MLLESLKLVGPAHGGIYNDHAYQVPFKAAGCALAVLALANCPLEADIRLVETVAERRCGGPPRASANKGPPVGLQTAVRAG
ncbi:MAG: hypothetical protein D6684_11255 [Deinococcus-Thermus bacterium]|nr:MAG: hypothetical protein D6684_11255 [Deinococcota bacterium]